MDARRRAHGSGGEAGAFPVFEAVLVALFIFAAMLFLAALNRPTADPGGQGSDLSTSAQQSLDILESMNLTVAGTDLTFGAWMTELMAGDAATAAEVDSFMRDFLAPGLRYAIRADNGVQQIHLLPADAVPSPLSARAATTILLPNWTAFKDKPIAFAAAPGGPMPFDPCAGGWTDVRGPPNGTTGPDGTAWGAWWCAQVEPALPGHAPAAAPLGTWRYSGAGCSDVCFFAVSLDGQATRHPVLAVQLVLWHAA